MTSLHKEVGVKNCVTVVSAKKNPKAVFLVILGMSSFPARHKVYGKTIENLMPSWERARTQHDYKYGLRICHFSLTTRPTPQKGQYFPNPKI